MRVDAINKGEMHVFASFILFLFFGVFCYENTNSYLSMASLILAIVINIWILFYLLNKILQNLGKTAYKVIIGLKEKFKNKFFLDIEHKDLPKTRRFSSISLDSNKDDYYSIDKSLLKRSDTML